MSLFRLGHIESTISTFVCLRCILRLPVIRNILNFIEDRTNQRLIYFIAIKFNQLLSKQDTEYNNLANKFD